VFLGKRNAGLDVGDDDARRHRLADFDHLALEAFAIFGELDRVERRAEELDVVAFEDAGCGKFDRMLRPVWPPSVGSSASGRSRAMIASIDFTVSGSRYTASAISGSVMIVAGFELTRTTRWPSSRKARHA